MEDSGTNRLRLLLRWAGIVALLLLCLSLAPSSAFAHHSSNPTAVVIAGSLTSEISSGACGDWQETCAASGLTVVNGSGGKIWRGVYTVPTGNWEYKMPVNNSWTENYPSSNRALNVGSPTSVRFYYDHRSHLVLDSVNNPRIPIVAGSFGSEITGGACGDWQETCVANLMTDPDGDGIATLTATGLPAGNNEFKVTINESWGESYPGGNYSFNVPSSFATVRIHFNLSTNAISVEVLGGAGPDNNIWWGDVHHDSRDTTYRNPGGPAEINTPVTLRLKTAAGDLTSATVRVWNDRTNVEFFLPMTRAYNDLTSEYWEATMPASAVPTIYWYRFIIADGSDTDYYEDDARRRGGAGEVLEDTLDRGWQLTVYDPDLSTPDWVKDAVIYQIFPDRFRNGSTANDTPPASFFYADPNQTITRSNTAFGTGNVWNAPICDPRNGATGTPNCLNYYSNNFYGGDLQGITDKIAYLQSIGVTAIYLNPIFESPSNHKYDTTDYGVVDDNFGGNAAFTALVAAADAAGMEIILDGVFNHTSSDSVYFDRYSNFPLVVGACESLSSPMRDWYFFTGSGPCAGQNYESWFGYDSLPKLDGTNDEVRDLIWQGGTPSPSSNIAAYWLQQGADGWRLDVGGDLDQGTINSPSNDYWEGFHAAVNAATPGDEYIVGEEWGNATSWVVGDEWDATMNYQFASAILSFWRDETFVDNDHNSGSSAGELTPLTADELNERLLHLQEIYPAESLYAMMNLLGSHDTNRPLFMLDENADEGATTRATYENPSYDWSDAISRLKGVALLQFTMPGAPTVYYGDEIGLVAPVSKDGSGWQDDPYNRIPFPWMDVTGNPEAGTGTPYYTHLQTEAGQDQLRDHYALLANTRNAHPALRTGDFRPLQTHNANQTYVYGRRIDDLSDAAVVFVNRSNTVRNITVSVGGYLPNGLQLEDAFTSTVYTVTGGNITVNNIPARGGALLVMVEDQIVLTPTTPQITATSGNQQITINWLNMAGTTDYDVYRAPMSGGPYTLIGSVSSTPYVDNGLVNGTKYYYVVVGRTGGLSTDFSNEVLGVPGLPIGWCGLVFPASMNHIAGAAPTANFYGQVYIDNYTSGAGQQPGVMAQVGYGPDGVAPTNPAWIWANASFNVQQGNNDEYQGNFVVSTAGSYDTAYRFSTTGGTSWTVCGTGGPTPFVPGELNVAASTDANPPSAPVLSITASGGGFVDLDWTASTDGEGAIFGYEVYRSTTNGGPYTSIGTTTGSDTDYTDNTVNNGITYYYVVKAIDQSFNYSANSNQVSVTVVARNVTVTFRVGVPAYTPAGDTVYIVGDHANLCGWCNPHTQAMTKINATTWQYTTTMLEGTVVNFKFTRGNWDKVEDWGTITGLGNRNATVVYGAGGTHLIDMTATNWGSGADSTKAVRYWHDPLVVSHTPANGALTVSETSPITVQWSIPMQGTPDFTVTSGGMPVAGTFSYDSGTWVSTFTPTGAMPPNATINVNVTGETAQNGMGQLVARSFSFKTGNALGLPVVVGETPGTTSCAKMQATVWLKLRNLNPGTSYRMTIQVRHPGTSQVYMTRQTNMTFNGPAGTQLTFKLIMFPVNDNLALVPGGWTYNSTWTTLPSPNNPVEVWYSMSNLSNGSFTRTKLSYTCNTGVVSTISTEYSTTTPAGYAP